MWQGRGVAMQVYRKSGRLTAMNPEGSMRMDKLVHVMTGIVALAVILSLSACAHYVTPGGRADFTRLTDTNSSGDGKTDPYSAKPEAHFPANLAVVRIQAPKYRSYGAEGYADGDFSVVTVREFEDDSHFKRLQSMPEVEGVAPLNRLLLPLRLKGNEQLRQAAAKLQTDILLVYTIDTVFFDRQKSVALSVISFGFLPTKDVRVTSTASALLIDVRSGFIYGAAENTQRAEQGAGVWSTAAAAEETRVKTEKAAFDNLIGEIEKLWPDVVSRYGR
jgi:hypothetical protein